MVETGTGPESGSGPLEISLGDSNPPEENTEAAISVENAAENAEAEGRVDNALNIIEGDDKSDPVLSSEWIDRAKKFVVGSGKIAGKSAAPLLGTIGVLLLGLIKGALYAPVKIIDYGVKDAMKRGGAPDAAKKFVDYKPSKKEKKDK